MPEFSHVVRSVAAFEGGASITIMLLTFGRMLVYAEGTRVAEERAYQAAIVVFLMVHASIVAYIITLLLSRWNLPLGWQTYGAVWIFTLKLALAMLISHGFKNRRRQYRAAMGTDQGIRSLG